MDFLNDFLKKINSNQTNSDEGPNLIDKINFDINQWKKEKTDLEGLIAFKKDELNKFQEILDLIIKSEDIQSKIKDFFKCKKCSSDLHYVNRTETCNRTQNGSKIEQAVSNTVKTTSNIFNNTPNNVNKSIQITKKETKPSQNDSQTFNRIQNIINNCVNKPKKESNKFEYSVDNKGVKINRTKPYPGYENNSQAFNYAQFKLVEMHMKEPEMIDFNSIKNWTTLEKKNNNINLEHKITIRNKLKISNLKQLMDNDTYEELMQRDDLINDMKMLMNYDFCNNKHGYRKSKPKKVRKKENVEKKTEILEVNKPKVNEKEDIMFELYGFETDNKENKLNNHSDDLYDDLNDDPLMDVNEIVQNVKLEDGELNEDSKIDASNKISIKEDRKEIKQVLSPRKENRNSNIYKKPQDDFYSQRRGSDRYNERFKSNSRYSRSRSGSRSKKRSRSKTRSRSRSRGASKRREYDQGYNDRKSKHESSSYNYKPRDSYSNSKYRK